MMTLLLLITVAASMCWVPSPTRKGNTTVTWGTNSVATGAINTAVVTRARFNPKKFRAELENNDGFTYATVDLLDGRDVELECLFDTVITWPAEGDVITVNRRGVAVKFEVTEIEDVLERKK